MTAETLYEEFCKLSNKTGSYVIPWKGCHPEVQRTWFGMIEFIEGRYTGELEPHRAPGPRFVKGNKDTSWGQFFQKNTGINEERIKQLWKNGYTKEQIMHLYANLSWDEMERILA